MPSDPGGSAFITTPLLEALTDRWWLLRWRGVAALAFGILAFHWPGLTLHTLTLLWGAYSLVDGLLALWAAIRGKLATPRLWLAAMGVAGLVSALLAFAMPATVAGLLVFFVSGWAIFTGALQVWIAVQLRKAVEGDWILVLDGVMAIVFGLALLIWPHLEIIALAWLVAWFAIALGTTYLGLGYWLRHPR